MRTLIASPVCTRQRLESEQHKHDLISLFLCSLSSQARSNVAWVPSPSYSRVIGAEHKFGEQSSDADGPVSDRDCLDHCPFHESFSGGQRKLLLKSFRVSALIARYGLCQRSFTRGNSPHGRIGKAWLLW